MMSTRPVVEFFFSPGSRYCYLAASQVLRIEAETGSHFDWRPVQGEEIRSIRGRDPFKAEPLSGQYEWGYRERDAKMWAAYYGIPFREPPSHMLDFDLLARTAAAGKLLGKATALGWALCSTAYGSKTWPIDKDVCLSLGESVGVATADLEVLLTNGASRSLLSRSAREAVERGAFGVPTFFFNGDMYWGNDRLVLLEHALSLADR